MDTRPIGIFDSGSGGLTAVRALEQLLPNEAIIYVGDTARMPYGSRSRREISQFSHEIVAYLLRQNVKAIIAACGTISTNAPELRQEAAIPYYDVISASAAAAAQKTKSGRVGLVATSATIRSKSFAEAVEAVTGQPVTAVACPLLAPMIEHGATAADPALCRAVETYCQPLLAASVDTVILGCTHFPLVAGVFARVLGPKVSLIDSGAEAAWYTARALGALALLSESAPTPPRFYFTGDAAKTARQAGAYLYGRDISAETQELSLNDLLQGGTI